MPRLWLLVLWLSVAAAQVYWFAALREQPDTATYAAAMEQAATGEPLDRLLRWARPLSLLLPFGLVQIFGFSALGALLLQQYAAMMLAAAFFALWLRRAGESAEQGLFLWLCASPVPVYAWAAINDVAGWAAALGLLLLLPEKDNARQSGRMGALLGVAVFIKESALLAGWYWAWLWLWRERRLRTALTTLLGFGLVVALGLWATKSAVGYNLLDWLRMNHDGDEANMYADWRRAYLVQVLRTLDVYWLFVLAAPFVASRQNDAASKRALWSAAIAALLVYPLAWSYMSDRILFLFAPLWLLLAVRGLRLWGRGAWAALLVASAANLCAAHSSYIEPLPFGLAGIYTAAALLLGFLLLLSRSTKS